MAKNNIPSFFTTNARRRAARKTQNKFLLKKSLQEAKETFSKESARQQSPEEVDPGQQDPAKPQDNSEEV